MAAITYTLAEVGFGENLRLEGSATAGTGNVLNNVITGNIQLDRTIFTRIATGNLAEGAFYRGAAAHDATDRVIYNSNTGNLYYAADGSGSGSSAILFATLAGTPDIAYTDFFIVA